MARSKKIKRPNKRQPTFFETMPMFIAPTTPLPELTDLPTSFRDAVTGFRLPELWQPTLWRQFAITKLTWTRAALNRLNRAILSAGLATTNQLLNAAQTAHYAATYLVDATRTYTPALAGDLGQAAKRTIRAGVGRRARLLYLAVLATTISASIAVSVKMANATLITYSHDISTPVALLSKKKTGTTILDRNGHVLFEGYGAQVSQTAALADLPQNLKDATLAAEDPTFYDHPGFSWQATARAAWVDITHGSRAEGGSTLTQQLVKNALLTSDKKFERKFQEILLAVALEHQYSKDQILGMYLNEIYYGQGASGVEAAAQTYFHKSARNLTLGQSALLAGLPLGPSRFDPNVDRTAAIGRRNYVLGRMQTLGKITKAQADTARAEPITAYARTITVKAPWFVFYVLNQLRNQYGDQLVDQGGITVQTTLDLSKQDLAQQIVAAKVGALADHHVTNGSLISLEPATGDILAMVGSLDYNAPGFGSFNVTLAERQPGSSFKPIAYATAFKKGYTGATHIDDTPLSVPNGNGTNYEPQNYDLRFHGSVSLRHALDNSLNIPAVKVLQYAGIHDTIQTAHDLGITSLQDESRYGLALVLGGGDVRPIDMATAYATFANNGIKILPKSILKVTDRYGKTITSSPTPAAQTVIDPRIAYMITNILSDDASRQPEFPANGPLTLPGRPAAAKTGTTNNFRDNWTVGYTPQLVTAVWVGNNDNSKMENVDGITGAAPIWHDYMAAALADQPVESFTAPPGLTTARVCLADGGLANPWDPSVDEIFMTDALPSKPCNGQPLAEVTAQSGIPFDFPPALTPAILSRRNKHHDPIFDF